MIQHEKSGCASASRALAGDYPVRVIASWESLRRVLRAERRVTPPDLVVADMDSLDQSLALADAFLRDTFPDASRVYLCPPGTDTSVCDPTRANASKAMFLFAKPIDAFTLSVFCREILRENATQDEDEAVVRFRDLSLDTRDFRFGIMPESPSDQLPPKEARLLRMLMESPGRCLSRDSIRTAIWGETAVTPRTIDSHISRLRQRIQGSEVSIESVYGGGYMLR